MLFANNANQNNFDSSQMHTAARIKMRRESHGKFCRICLHSSEPLHSLSSATVSAAGPTGPEIPLADIYESFTQLAYSHGNWEFVCSSCYDKLVEFHNFRQLCVETWQKLSAPPKAEPVDFEPAAVCTVEVLENDVLIKADYDSESEQSYDHLGPADDDGSDESEWPAKPQVKSAAQTKQQKTIPNASKELPKEYPEADKRDAKSRRTPRQAKVKQTYGPKRPKTNKSQAKKDDTESAAAAPFIVCTLCPAKFFKQTRFDAHMRKHQGLKQWQCDLCSKGFAKQETLRMHVKTIHTDPIEEKPRYICDMCEKVYWAKESLRLHLLHVHMGRRLEMTPRICEQCGKIFKNNADLKKHMYTHTADKPFKCQFDGCVKQFIDSQRLRDHMLRHKGIKNFVCPTCGLRKTTMHELRSHMRFHDPDLKFPCTLCDVVFSRPTNLKRHTNVVHRGIKKYPCAHCGKSFGKAETRKYHEMTHTGERPLECAICQRRFIQPAALKTHMKTHSKG